MIMKNLFFLVYNLNHKRKWMSVISEILKVKELPIKYHIVFFILGVFLIFLPNDILLQLGILKFLEEYNSYITLFTMGIGLLLIIKFMIFIWKDYINPFRDKCTYIKEIEEQISNLKDSEKTILREFFIQNENIIKLSADNPNVLRLHELGILILISKDKAGYFQNLCYFEISSNIDKETLKKKINITK